MAKYRVTVEIGGAVRTIEVEADFMGRSNLPGFIELANRGHSVVRMPADRLMLVERVSPVPAPPPVPDKTADELAAECGEAVAKVLKKS